jgi:IclR family acetate operon transcriptional repressor
MAIVKSADRVVRILEAIGSKEGGLTHGELSKMLGIPKGSLSKLLSNLVDRSYLFFDPTSQLYTLGSEILVLTGRYLNNLDIMQVGRPVLHKLVEEIAEDAQIAIRRGDQVLFLYKVESPKPVKYAIAPGQLAPLYAVSPGKCVLAFTPKEEVAAYLDRVALSPITANTITDRDVFMAELESIRAAGLAFAKEEYQQGICGMAAPVFNIHGLLAASIVVTMQTIEFDSPHTALIGSKLKDAAANLSRRMGFGGASKK